MANTNATILIPDISGFTEFMTNTEKGHGSFVIKYLLDAIIQAVGDEYEVSEIEGDAVLMFKRGSSPSKKEILTTCLKIFNAFHYQRKWMQQHSVCPCGACLAIDGLTLKFVAHHGHVDEMRIGRFVTLSGTDVIIAHRLMKNSIDSHEYVLLTEQLLQELPDSYESLDFEWTNLYDEFASIGKVDYRFAKLEKARTKIPEPTSPQNKYTADSTPYFRLPVNANFRDVYMVVMNIPDRAQWVPGLKKVEQDDPDVFVGSIHHFTFENYKAIVSPLQMNYSVKEILYAESCRLPDLNIELVYEYLFKRVMEAECEFGCRIINVGRSSNTEEINSTLHDNMKQMAHKLKTYSEALKKSFF